MATFILNGQTTWSMSRDEEGHRTYKIVFRVRGSSLDGPANVIQTPGLPIPGGPWIVDNDVDLWAWFRPTMQVDPVISGEPNREWTVECMASTKPAPFEKQRCADMQIENPLLEPQKVNGSSVKYTEEVTKAKRVTYTNPSDPLYEAFWTKTTNSAFEQIRGPQVEFDRNRDMVRVEQNVPFLQLSLCTSMRDTVNQFPLWGMPARCVKLSNFTWERHFHGYCYVYYKRVFEFDIAAKLDAAGNVISAFDRDVMDEGSKVLRGYWDTDPASATFKEYIVATGADERNPADYVKFQDFHGNTARVILTGQGEPVNTEDQWTTNDEPGNINIQYYEESNFLLLGIPTSF